MKTTAEIEIVVSEGRITNINLPNGKYKLVVEQEIQEIERTVEFQSEVKAEKPFFESNQGDCFVLVEASKLSLDDEFMKHEPKTDPERIFKERVENAIKRGLKDFYRPKYDPSFSYRPKRLCYDSGKHPVVGGSYKWWAKVAKEVNPERNSRLGTETEYIAFLAVLIKKLVASGKSIERAWDNVCNSSYSLGNYRRNFEDKAYLEMTGSNEICGVYDLSNTFKLFAADDNKDYNFCVAGGCYLCDTANGIFALATMSTYKCSYHKSTSELTTGWIVLDCCPDC